MPRIIRRLTLPAVAALALIAAGCSASQKPAADATAKAAAPVPMGRIHLNYEYTAADLASPPRAFHVLRAPDAAGPFARITDKPIAPKTKPAAGAVEHLLTDEPLPMNATYYYYIEVVDGQGRTRKATDTVAARVVLPAAQKR